MRWAGNVARLGKKLITVFVGSLKEKEHLEDIGVDGILLTCP